MSRFQKLRTTARAIAVTTLMTFSTIAAADDYPSQTVHIVVPWAAGGGTDAIARAFAEGFSEVSGQSVVIDNITGASGATGTARAMRARPDGYTLVLNGSSDMNSTLAFRSQPYELDDFVYIGGVYDSPTWLVANAERGYKSYEDFRDAAKKSPGQLTIAVGGTANAHTLMAAAIRSMGEIDVRIIPYGGGADVRRALLANEVDAGVIHAPVMLGEIREGLINVLTVGGSLERIHHEPLRDTPTLRDHGIPADFGVVRMIMAPKGLPDETRAEIERIAEKAVATEHYRKFGEKFGFAPVWMSSKEADALMRAELASFREIKTKYLD
ncbi:Bug family tripartite tricarboxylate transporter substrate binding protein [Pseudazoarcus pumilus]|nr:tripartite tricarboxylate transporter substrate binding protein [Pseudazoarcus pumilus]